jgi:hypothetical protein
MDILDINQTGSTFKDVGAILSSSNVTRIATINHRPSVCANPLSCYYLIAVYQP